MASQVGRQGLGLILGIILARLLSPHEFGLIAMVLVFSGFAALITEFGFVSTLVQKRDIRDDHLDSVFWVNVGLGLALALAFVVFAPLIGEFYGQPGLTAPARAMAAAFLLWTVSTVQRALLSRDLDFKRLAIAEIGGMGLGGVAAVLAALAGMGVWSLVIQQLLQPALSSLALWMLCPWRPRLRFRWAALRDLMGFGLNVLGYRSLSHWSHNFDSLLVGRFLGSSALGIYDLAYRIMQFPVWNVSRSLHRVMFSSFSRIQDQRDRIRELFLRAVSVVAFLVFPMMLGTMATAPYLVDTLFGSDWLPMAPVLQIFCIASILDSVAGLTSMLFLSQGRADLQLRLGVFLKFNTFAGIVIGLNWGVTGVAAGYTVASIVNFYPAFHFSGSLVSMPFRRVVGTALPTLAGSSAMAVTVQFVSGLLPPGWSSPLRLLVLVPLGVLIYAGIAFGFRFKAWEESRKLLRNQLLLWRVR
jgi:PST family polysaccharide transporter